MMNFFTGTVSLISLGGINLALPSVDTLMVGQSSEVILSQDSGNAVGTFEYTNAKLPAYYLNDELLPSEESVSLKENQFCIGLKTSREANYFVVLCKQFEQVDVSELAHTIQELPSFMCHEKTVVDALFKHQEKVYLVTNPDKLLDYIAGNGIDKNLEIKNA